MFIQVWTPFREDVVSLSQEIEKDIYIGNCITTPHNNKAYVSVINASDTDVILEKLPELVPLKEFNVLYADTGNSKGLSHNYFKSVDNK